MHRLTLWLIALAGCAAAPSTDAGSTPVSFRNDVAPLFAAHCIACHFPPLLTDLSTASALVNQPNTWTEARHKVLVVPGKPEESALLDKLEATDLDEHTEGARMPFVVPAVTAQERDAVRQWIADGARDDDFYRANVVPLFGVAVNLGSTIGKCSYCHTATSPYPPNLVDPFDPVRGVVNVRAGSGGFRVVPGNPDASVLLMKLSTPLPPRIGAAMPFAYAPMTAGEIDTIREWIRQGAKDN